MWQKKIRKFILKCQDALVDGNTKFIEQLEFRRSMFTAVLRVLQGNVKTLFGISGKSAEDIAKAQNEILKVRLLTLIHADAYLIIYIHVLLWNAAERRTL
jgi:hypothetical protein